jgi:hypothetical protein
VHNWPALKESCCPNTLQQLSHSSIQLPVWPMGNFLAEHTPHELPVTQHAQLLHSTILTAAQSVCMGYTSVFCCWHRFADCSSCWQLGLDLEQICC